LGKIRILLTGCGGIAGRNVIDHFLIGEFVVLALSSRELNLLDFYAVQAYLQVADSSTKCNFK